MADESGYGETLPSGAIPAGPVEYWAALGDYPLTEEAIAAGNEVNATSANGHTALHAAATNGHLDVVKLLLESRAASRRGTSATGAA